MAVLKILISAALLGTVARCQNYYSAYSPGGSSGSPSSYGQYSPSILSRGTPRLVPVKVRSSSSRLFPSYFYPGPPPPPPPHYPHSLSPYQPQMHSQHSTYPSHHNTPTFPRHQQYRTAMTGYYRPTRQSSSSYFSSSNPYHRENTQHTQYHTAATSAPVVLKRGRVLSAPSPYSLEAASASSSAASSGGAQYSPQYSVLPAYRPQQYQPQISASPVHHQPQQYAQQQAQQQYQQPTYYINKGPVVVGQGRPVVKVARVKKPLPLPQRVAETKAAEPEEEYPSDPNPQYNFSFDIKDDELTNYQNRQEERVGQTIKGSYSVVDPDGYVRTVTYTADPKNGFQAKVTREPTDVKIKFPVPTQAPASAGPLYDSTHEAGKHAGPARRGQAYNSPQTQYQPQYQSASYATPQQVYASSAESQPQVQVQPQYVPRTTSRFAIQPQVQASSPRARITRRIRRPRPSARPTEQPEEKEEK